MRTFRLSICLVVVVVASIAVSEIHASYRIFHVETPVTIPYEPVVFQSQFSGDGYCETDPPKQPIPFEIEYGKMVGQIWKSESTEAIADVVVVAVHERTQSRYRTQTDSEGRFTFDNLPVGGFVLFLDTPEQELEFASLKVVREKTTLVELSLVF